MELTYWDTLSTDYHFFETDDTKYLVDKIIDLDIKSLFEGSVGSGTIPNSLRKKGWEGIYLGSDYCEMFLKAAKENNPDENFIEVDFLKPIPLPNNCYECSVVRHGLEYVYPYELALKELKRISSKYVLIDFWVPFFDDRPNQIRFNYEKGWNVNFYNKKEFLDTLSRVGLEIEEDVVVENSHDNKSNYIYLLSV